ncbi:MAG: TetR/AcrR family transcriptional regulator, partial [bacterium]|nr:TetR/AcrR family transcriptional regulator [bacterium]
AAVANIRNAVSDRLRARIERDVGGELLPPTTDAAALAGLVMTVIQGMSVLARDGTPRTSLLGIVDAALKGWPTMVETRSA